MAKTRISIEVSVSCLIFSLVLFACSTPSSSSSDDGDDEFHVLDVSSSLQQTRHVFSQPLQQTRVSTIQQLRNYSSDYSQLSLTLRPRSSLRSENQKNYTQLTLSRLARDVARVGSIMSTHSRALSRSHRRPGKLESPVVSGVGQGSGDYFARIGVGRPATEYYMVIDGGSDISWLQCDPCLDCYQQSDPIYNPYASSTYKQLACDSRECRLLRGGSAYWCDTCLYQVSYADGSHTIGNLATETITFGSSGSVSDVAIGCGHDNEGLFSGAAGLLGLGGGPLSLPSQIHATSFSYCLVNRDSDSSSTLDFNSTKLPPGSVLAPLIRNPLIKTFYYVGLTGISVGGRPVRIPSSFFEIGQYGDGGVIMDSGTAVTRFREEVYRLFRDAFASMAHGLPPAAGFSLLDTCYDFSNIATVSVPTVSFQFSGGKTLPLPPRNYLIPVDDAGRFCFAFAGTPQSMSIIGNVQQQGTRVSYNLANKYIAFSPKQC